MTGLLLVLFACAPAPAPVGVGGVADLVPFTAVPTGGAYVDYQDAPRTRIMLRRTGDDRLLVDDGGSPDRPTLSADGGTLAYVSAPDGLAAVFVFELATETTRQLTNLEPRQPGRLGPPAGFVDVPRTAPRFEGDDLVWLVGQDTVRVSWR